MKKDLLISEQQIEEFEKIFANEKKIVEFKDFLNSLESDEARIELIKTKDIILDDIVCLEDRKKQLFEFLNSIKSYDKKLDFIREIHDGFRYHMVYFHYEIFDILQPEDIKKIIKKKDLDTKSDLFTKLIITSSDTKSDASTLEKISESKQIFFEDDDVKKDENYKILCDAKVNFQILSLLANSNGVGVGLGDEEPLLMHHIKKTKEELPKNPLPDIYAEMMSKVDSDQAIELSEGQKIFLRRSKLKEHSSYFIFHVNAQNQLTKISYCDGNKVSDQRSIVGSRTHINSITNYELANPIDFSPEFADKFIKENSQKEDILDFYNKISAENFKFKGLEETSISSITYEMPREKQKRGNCVMKSTNILACAILQLKDPSQEFIWDKKAKKPAGKGYENYKEFKNTLSKLALEELEMIMPEIQKIKPKKDGYKRELFEVMEEVFLKRIELTKDHFADKVKKKSKEYSTSTPSCFSFLSYIGKFFSKKKDVKLSPPDTITTEIKSANMVLIDGRGLNLLPTQELPAQELPAPKKSFFWRGSARF